MANPNPNDIFFNRENGTGKDEEIKVIPIEKMVIDIGKVESADVVLVGIEFPNNRKILAFTPQQAEDLCSQINVSLDRMSSKWN